MRHLLIFLLLTGCVDAGAQYDRLSFRYNYAFVEDGPTLTPLKGTYRVEYIGRGQYWTVTDPRWTVHFPGQPRSLTPCIKVNGAPLMVVEMDRIFGYPDNKLIVLRGTDTMIVDLNQDGRLETLMLERAAKLGVPPRPPVLLPFRKGWFTNIDLVQEAQSIANTERLDALWASRRAEVLALYDTARHSFTLEMDGLRTGAVGIVIDRDPNYARHLLEFPASGPSTHFELFLQDSTGVPSKAMSLRVDMPPDGETSTWVDVTDMPYGRYTAYLKWGKEESLFYLSFGW
ncbi:MAG: hypothetical protein IPJ76_03565 [Flavobacteriales bacterium]|nr:MAG: hypothetical protein IPJ76_03565 [Flavobacteriales bacterium]